MGQKTNPNILQINKTNKWDSQYIEKKPKDFYLYSIKDLEVKKFIYKFFKNCGLNIHTCKLNYLNNNLNLYISYQQNHNSVLLMRNINKNQKIKFTKNLSKKKVINPKFYNNLKNYYNYEYLNFKNKLPKNSTKKSVLVAKRIKLLTYYKKYLTLKKNKKIKNLIINNFFNKFFQSLTMFYNNSLIKITLIIQPLNSKLFNLFNKKKRYFFQTKLIKLKKFQRNAFFKEGTNTIFSLINNPNSAFLLSNFISITLKKLKKHNFFLKFIRKILKSFIFYSNSKIKGIKIRIKGRLNKASRAKKKIITIGNLPIFTVDSNIKYSETTSYTANGTLGIKVWICYVKTPINVKRA